MRIAIWAVCLMSICALRLGSGLRVALLERPGSPSVSISTWIETGSADDPLGKAGLAHLFEHMLFKGTATRGVGDIAAEIESVGGDINAWTTFDNIVISVRVPPEQLTLGIDVVADMMTSPRLAADELELERQVVLDELDQASVDPQRRLGRALFTTVFRRHPYRRPILGTRRSIDAIDATTLESFASFALASNRVVMSIAGDFDTEVAKTAVASKVTLCPSATTVDRPLLSRQTETRERIVRAPVAESQMILAFPSPPLASRDHLLLDMISIALGQGASSTLATRLESETATSTGAYVHGFRDAGLFVATASADAEDTFECAEELAAAVFEATREALSSESLAMVKNAIISDSVYGRETVSGVATAMGSAWTHSGDPEADTKRVAWARAATATDLLDAARRTLVPERATFAAMLPEDAARPRAGRFAEMIERVGDKLRAAPKPAAKKAAPTKRVELPNGAVVLIHRDNTIPLVAAQATWPGGQRNETEKTAGIGSLLARTIVRGCGERTDSEVSRLLDRRAATLSGFSGRNSFGLRSEWIADGSMIGLELLLDCLVAPQFASRIVEDERRQLADEAQSRGDSPAHLAHKMFSRALHGAHPYALDPFGEVAGLEAMTGSPDKIVRSHYENFYPVSAVAIAVVGDVDPDAVARRIEQRLARLPKRAAKKASVTAATRSAEREHYAYVDRGRAHLVLGFPGVSLADTDRGALEVLSVILGGQGGRLFESLREKRGLVYRVSAHSIEGIDPGAFAITTSCAPANVDAARTVIGDEIARLRDDLVTKAELERATAFLRHGENHALERRSNLAAALAFAETHGMGAKSVFDARSRWLDLTPEDIRRVARRILDEKLMIAATVLPPTATPAVKKRARGVRRRVRPKAARKRSP